MLIANLQKILTNLLGLLDFTSVAPYLCGSGISFDPEFIAQFGRQKTFGDPAPASADD
jgi:hypothetical protein